MSDANVEWWTIPVVLCVPILAGAAGGIANCLLSKSRVPAPNANDGLPWYGYMFVGIVAAFTVPLFLNLTNSSLLQDWLDGPTKSEGIVNLLVFAGFCLVAAFSSRAFMQGMADRVLAQLKAAEQKMEEAKNAVEQTKTEVAQAKEHIDQAKADTQRVVESAGSVLERAAVKKPAADQPLDEGVWQSFSDTDKKILSSLTEKAKSADEIATELGVPKLTLLDRYFSTYAPKGLVHRELTGDTVAFQLTDRGNEMLNKAGGETV